MEGAAADRHPERNAGPRVLRRAQSCSQRRGRRTRTPSSDGLRAKGRPADPLDSPGRPRQTTPLGTPILVLLVHMRDSGTVVHMWAKIWSCREDPVHDNEDHDQAGSSLPPASASEYFLQHDLQCGFKFVNSESTWRHSKPDPAWPQAAAGGNCKQAQARIRVMPAGARGCEPIPSTVPAADVTAANHSGPPRNVGHCLHQMCVCVYRYV